MFRILKQAIRGYVRRSVVIPGLILLSTISTGCTTKTPERQPDSAICREPNEVQSESWRNMVALAKLDLDPFEVRDGVLWAGGHLWRCDGRSQ